MKFWKIIISLLLVGAALCAFAAPEWNFTGPIPLDTRDDDAPGWNFAPTNTVETRLAEANISFSPSADINTRSHATNLVLSASDSDSLSVNWNVYPSDLRGIEGYDVSWREFGDEEGAWDSLCVQPMQAVVDSLTPGTVYELQVRPVIGVQTQVWTQLDDDAYTLPGVVYENDACTVYQHAWTHQHGHEVPEMIGVHLFEWVVEEGAAESFVYWAEHTVSKAVVHAPKAMTFYTVAFSAMAEVIGGLFEDDYAKVKLIAYYPETLYRTLGPKIFENEPVYVEVLLDLTHAIHDLDGEVWLKSHSGFLAQRNDFSKPVEEFCLIPESEIARFKTGYMYRIIPKQPLCPWKMGWNLTKSSWHVAASIHGQGNGLVEDMISYDIVPVFKSEIAFYTRGTLSDGGAFSVLGYQDGTYKALFESVEFNKSASGMGYVGASATFGFSRGGLDFFGSFNFAAGGAIESVSVNVDDGNTSVWGTGDNLQNSSATPMALMAMSVTAPTVYSADDVPKGLHVMESENLTAYILVGPDGKYQVSVSQNGVTASATGTLNRDGSISVSSGDLTFNAVWGVGEVFSGSFTLGANDPVVVQTEVQYSANSIYTWYENHFGTNLVLSSQTLNNDGDADGLSCLLEYLCGLNPRTNDANQACGLSITTNAFGEQVLSRWFDVDTDSEAVSYVFSGSTTLTNWFVIDPALRTMSESNGTLRIRYDVPTGSNTVQFIRFNGSIQ